MQQIVAGLTMLEREDKIRCEYEEMSSLEGEFYNSAVIELQSKGRRVVCELSDGYNNYPSLKAFDSCLGGVDLFFKAVACSALHEGFANVRKIRGLPPRYNVTCRGSVLNKVSPSRFLRDSRTEVRKLWIRIPWAKNALRYRYVEAFEEEPHIDVPVKVFYYTRLWDPSIASERSSRNSDLDGRELEDRIAHKREEYETLSKLRAGLVHALKKEFGDRFIGGIAPESYATKMHPELLGEDISRRDRYTKALKSAPICVNTRGTHFCWNYSFGEGLAASRAIVTEEPFYDIPPHLTEGVNFLTYSSIDDCVGKVVELAESSDKVLRMMRSNRQYYLDYLRPDRYAQYIIAEAFGEGLCI